MAIFDFLIGGCSAGNPCDPPMGVNGCPVWRGRPVAPRLGVDGSRPLHSGSVGRRQEVQRREEPGKGLSPTMEAPGGRAGQGEGQGCRPPPWGAGEFLERQGARPSVGAGQGGPTFQAGVGMALGERLGRVQNPHLWRAAASAPEGARRRAPCPQALARPSASPPPQGTWTGTTTRCSPGSGRTASWSTWTTPGGERPRPAPRGPPGRLAFAFFFGHRRLVFVAAVALP